MRKLLFIVATCLFGSTLISQNFHNVGPYNTPVATFVTEADFAISTNGVPYVFYVTSTSNKGTVKKWDGTAWVTVGTPDFTSLNPFNIDLEVSGDNVYVAYYFVQGTGSASERVGVHRSLNGAAWSGMGSYDYASGGPGPIVADHNRPFDLEVSYSTIRLAFFDTYDEGLFKYCTWNNGNSSFEEINGLDLIDDDNDIVINQLKVNVDADGYEWYVASVEGMGFETLLFERTGGMWQNRGQVYGAQIESSKGVGMESYWDAGGNYIRHSIGGIMDQGSEILYHAQYYNDPTPGWETNYVAVDIGGNVQQFDMAANGSETFYFHTSGSVQLDEVDNMGNNISTFSNFGTAGPKTNLRVDVKNNGRPVISYITTGNLWVREEWNSVQFSMSDPETCSGQTEVFSGHISVTSHNLDNNDLTWNITPDQPNVMHLATGTGSAPTYDLNLGTYYQATDVTVEINVELLDEEGNVENDNQYYPLVKANDSIINNLPGSDICINHGPVNVMDFVYPQGGQFSGPLLPNGAFNPMMAGAGNHMITYTTYNAGSGCTNSLNIPITVNDIPFLTMNSTDAACGDSTGTASVMTSSTALPHTYYWNTGADSAILADLPSGQYVVTVTDNNGCMITGVANVGNTAVNMMANVSGVNCPDDNNGSIDLTVAGVGPFHILWSNGYGTEDITGLVPGPYDVVVTDANGCEGTATYVVSGPDAFNVTNVNTNSNCGADDGSIVLTVTGGTGSYTYQWYDENNNAIGTNSATVTGIGGGLFTCEITDASGCMHSFNTIVNENGAPVVTINQVTNASCTNDGEIDMSYTASAALDYIDWSNGETTEDITSLAPGHYAVWVVDVNGCVGMGEADVYPALPATPEICMVTVDSVTTTNLVVWEKPVTTGIAHYNIYREGSQAGLYQIVDSVPYTSDSEFNDIVASPMVRSWRYKLSAVDNCGNESALSDYHKTIHATISVGLGGNYNIHWDAYEGLTYTSWSCWRYTDAGGFEWIWTNSSNIFSYTDQPATTAGLDYVVGFPLGTTCTSSVFKAQDYNGTRSNRSAGIFNGSGLGLDEQTKKDFDVVLFPNPNDGEFKVHITGTANGNFDYQIIDIRGKIVTEGTQYLRKFNMNLNNLESGIYYLNITNEGLMKTQKLIIK